MKITIEFNQPEWTTKKEVFEYIKESLGIWGGQKRPEDPLFDGIIVDKIYEEAK